MSGHSHDGECSHGDFACPFSDDHPAMKMPKNVEESKEVYDAWSKTYDKDINLFNYNGHKLAAESIAKTIKNKDAEILDLGCCTGLVGLELQRCGFSNVDGLDISEECVKLAREKNAYRKIYIEETSPDKPLSFPTGSYDVVTVVGAGMFLDIKTMKDWLRITKTDGFVVIAVMESELTDKAFKPTVDEYLEKGLMKEVHKDIVKDFMMETNGAVVYYQPCRE
ncbi:methyltransferase-like protein 27 [Saccoglossus kowalevskii]|uniref:Uncharacterized protein LOC100375171 n=1 Tax=Saccoglossus kowalevskii TaxID=10224 RepID=A0ABM0GP60_SACKO|nr:PREDICTED: uncharacterized protein LOC100375171 [Saccoglossus kowalevskii]